MKIFAAALALSTAFCARAYGQNIDEITTCDGAKEVNRITELDFLNAIVKTNTLEIDGGELRYGNVGTYEGTDLDLLVTVTGGDYTDIAQSWAAQGKGNLNGLKPGTDFGKINLQTVNGKPKSGEGNFRFCLVEADTDTPKVVNHFVWSVYDTDERSNAIREKLAIDVSETVFYQLASDTELVTTCENGSTPPCPAGERTVFTSTVAGNGPDNPNDPNNLTPLQLRRSIAFTFENTDCWEITYDHFCPFEQPDNTDNSQTECVADYSGGNFLFSGGSKTLREEGDCITKAPTAAPTLPPVAPTDPPTVPPTPSEPTDSPTAECDVEINVCLAIDNSGSICTSTPSPRLCTNCGSFASCGAGGLPLGDSDLCCGNYEVVTEFAKGLLGDEEIIASASAVKFGSTANVISPQGDLTSTASAIESSPYTGGFTNTEAALTECKNLLDGKSRPYIVLVTDGTPTACNSPTNRFGYKDIFDGDCNVGNCAGCPNGDPVAAATVAADAAASEGITIIPVIVSTVSEDVDLLEGLARCPDGSTTCDAMELKGTNVDDVDGLSAMNTMLSNIVKAVECPTPPPPPVCEEDVKLLTIDGVTDIPLPGAVTTINQDTSSVDIQITNAWTSEGDTVDSIFYEYKINQYDDKCFEKQNVDGGGVVDDITIQCLHTEPYARLDICVADNGGATTTGDDAEVPKCCEPDLPAGTPVVCYKLLVWCQTQCVDDATIGRRALRGSNLTF